MFSVLKKLFKKPLVLTRPAPTNLAALDHGPELIQEFEKCVLTAYLDGYGIPTIGWGHTKGVKLGDRWTQQQADNEFGKDLHEFETGLVSYLNQVGLNLNAHEFAALTSFAYNLGLGSVKTLVANRTKAQIANALLLYHKSGGVVSRGLKIRRACERELFLLPIEQTTTWNAKAVRAKFTKEIK